MKTNVLTAITIAAVAAIAFTGCTGQQSVDAACKTASQEIESLKTNTFSALSEIRSDPSAAAKIFSDIEDGLTKAAANVSNGEVKPNLEQLAQTMGEFSQIFSEATGDISSVNTEKLATISTHMEELTSRLTKQCNL